MRKVVVLEGGVLQYEVLRRVVGGQVAQVHEGGSVGKEEEGKKNRHLETHITLQSQQIRPHIPLDIGHPALPQPLQSAL